MGLGLRVRYRATDGAVYGEQVLVRLPVRIGRNALNDCIIAHPYVSEFHAIIEIVRRAARRPRSEQQERHLHGRRGPAPCRSISPARGERERLRARAEHPRPGRAVRARRAGGRAAVSGARRRPRRRESYRPEQPGHVRERAPRRGLLPPLPLMGSPSTRQVGSLARFPPLSRWRARCRRGLRPCGRAAQRAGCDVGPRGRALHLAPRALAGPLSDRTHRRRRSRGPSLRAPAGDSTPCVKPRGVHRSTEQFAMDAQALAFSGLKELSASLVPGADLRTTGDVARLVTKLHDTIEVYCRCFVPMRAAYEQFVSQTYLQRSAVQRSLNRSESAMRVEVARDAASLASALLDWALPGTTTLRRRSRRSSRISRCTTSLSSRA